MFIGLKFLMLALFQFTVADKIFSQTIKDIATIYLLGAGKRTKVEFLFIAVKVATIADAVFLFGTGNNTGREENKG